MPGGGEWELDYYQEETGYDPVGEFIEDLNEQDSILAQIIMAMLRRLRFDNVDLSSRIAFPIPGSDIRQLKVAEKEDLAYDILFFEFAENTFVLLHALVRDKDQALLDPQDLDTAEERRADYIARAA